MRTIPAAMQTALDVGATTFCFCWKVEQTNGTVRGFTDHDVDVPGFDGVTTFERSTSFSASNIENQQGLAPSNVDVLGYLASGTLTEDDLECGRYDGAKLTIYFVNWQDPAAQNAIIISGILGEVTVGDLAYHAELRSKMQCFSEYVGSLCQQKCRSDLGDTGSGLEGGCRFAMPAAVVGTVASVTSRGEFSVHASGTFPDGTRGSLSGGYFAEGTATFTSGANNGVARDVTNSTYAATSPLATVGLTTAEPFPDDIQVGDTVEMQIGCDRTLDVCIKNYNNVANFRGEPYVPGTDSAFRMHNE